MNLSHRKVSEVKLRSDYLRKDSDVTSLKQSVRSVGLIHPVTINEENELLAGARRFQAVSELGWDEIPVHVVERDALVQELISIDENLVRSPLRGLELERCLNRGREIYEQLNPEANRLNLSDDDLSAEQKALERERDGEDEDSFAAVTAEKIGLSRSIIEGAIKRDALAAEGVKAARGRGELNATQTNELIRLEKGTQERVLPLIADKTIQDARRIVNAARAGGYEAALEESERVVPLPREYRQMMSPLRRVNQSMTRILAEELVYEGPERRKIHNELIALKNNLLRYFRLAGVDDEADGD